ncbi:MAG: ATP-binding protein [Candidatus Eremiobacterota bacterium]
MLDQVSYLYDEPRFLLQQELREPANYFALLRSMAGGCTRLNEIAQDAGVASNFASRYLDTLMRLDLVHRIVPATEKNPDRSRKGLYRISDPFLRFWFRFVLPGRSDLEMNAWMALSSGASNPDWTTPWPAASRSCFGSGSRAYARGSFPTG